jgi:hypothetical protein
MNDNDLRQSSQEGAAKSGAVFAETLVITPESLAAALLSLSAADRARLAELLARQRREQGNSE